MLQNRVMIKSARNICSTTSAPVVILNSSGEIIWINDAFQKISGYCLEDLEVDCCRFIPVQYGEKFKDTINLALKGNPTDPFDIPVICSDSIVKKIRWVTMLIDDKYPEKKAVVLLGATDDNTGKIRSDIEIAEERYRLLFENTGVSMMFVAEDTTIALINKECEKLTGYSKTQVERKMSWIDFIAFEDDVNRMKNFHYLRRIDTNSVPDAYDTVIKTRDGVMRKVMVRVTMIPETGYSLISLIDMTERIIAEEALRESEEKLRSLVDNMQDTLYRCDLEGNITFISPSSVRLLGYDSVKEMIGKNIAKDFYYSPVDRVHLLNELAKNGKVAHFEVTLKHRDESPIAISTNSQFFYDKEGNVLGVEGIFSDITERKEAERRLRENEERLLGITNNIPGSIFQFYAKDDGEYGISYVSERLVELLSLSSDPDALFPTLLSHIYEEDREGFLASIFKAAGGCSSWNFEGRIAHPSGKLLWFQGFATPTRQEDGSVFNGILLDITERKQAEEMSRQSEEKFIKIFMTTPDCIFITRMRDGLIIDVNMGFEEITGWKRNEAVGATSYDLGFWCDSVARNYMVDELSEDRDILHHEFQFKRSDGTLRTGVYSARSINIAGEDCLIFVLQDITERRLMAEERLELEHKLYQSQKMDAIGQLASGLAHDFNNILMGIQANASLMMMEHDPGHPHYQRLKRMEEHIRRGANLTSQLLGFAREGKYEVKAISINDLIRKSVQFFIETRREINAVLQLQDDLYPVEADQGQIDQVLLNVYINAGHAMSKGGHLDIKTVNVTLHEADAVILNTKPGHYVKISITDTGIGMDAKTLERIFEPFFTTKSDHGGTGLGLASAYGIIRNHGGIINANSKPGQGSTFNIYLPSSIREIEEKEKKEKNEILSGRGGILLIDDEEMILETASDLLERMGYTVYQASSGKDAVSIYNENRDRIDLVILDIILPGMSGSSLFGILKDINPDVKVILSSGYGLQGEVRNLMEMGCKGFIQKPYDVVSLSDMVHHALFSD